MIIVNPIQSFTEQDMSDDPIYPSPTVKGSKKYNTRAQGSNLCSTGYNQSWAQEIFKAGSVCWLLIQLILKVRIRLCRFQCYEWPQRARVPSSPSVIKYKYCKDLAV